MDIISAVYWMSLNVFFEARNQPYSDKVCITHVVLNRARTRKISVKQVIFQHKQFSWTNSSDPQKKQITLEQFPVFLECLKSVYTAMEQELSGDTLFGAEYYFNPHYTNPVWAKNLILVYKGKDHSFYRR